MLGIPGYKRQIDPLCTSEVYCLTSKMYIEQEIANVMNVILICRGLWGYIRRNLTQNADESGMAPLTKCYLT